MPPSAAAPAPGPSRSYLFRRGPGPHPVAVSGNGAWVVDADGNRYLDAAGGAIVVGVGHGDADIAAAMATQAGRLAYVHGTAFTTEVAEQYAAALAAHLPVDDPRVYPVSGGSEAVETALKLARSYHLARGEPDRTVVLARRRSYHGGTIRGLDLSDRPGLSGPYQPWLGTTERVPAAYEYRCENPRHPERCGDWHAAEIERVVDRVGPRRVAALVAEPIGGAASGAALPPDGYWDLVAEVCRRHGILLVADEVMTGFGRTGQWFASDHFGLRPDILAAAKGASSGYWPLGLCVASGAVHDTVAATGFVHGFTSSHHPVGAAVGLAVVRAIEARGLVEAARRQGTALLEGLRGTVGSHPLVGDVRGAGLLAAVELVADRGSKTPFPVADRVAARVTAEAKRRGLLVYPSTGCVDGVNGDLVMLGPPLSVTAEEVGLVVDRLAAAVDSVQG
jgi:adenosylmethionine-8-amino-7-oxononanoate aminotransferase